MRWWVVGAGVAVGLAAVAHASPLIAWHLGVARSLRSAPDAHRLRSPSLETFPEVPSDWEGWTVGDLRFALPAGARQARGCETPDSACFIRIPGDGQRAAASLSVFPLGHEEPYQEMLDFRAPDERDLSLWRSAAANWATVGALQTFVLTSRAKLDSSRFRSEGARGVFVHTIREGRSRWVVSAYEPDGERTRGITVAGLPETAFRALLGSLDLRQSAAGRASHTPGTDAP